MFRCIRVTLLCRLRAVQKRKLCRNSFIPLDFSVSSLTTDRFQIPHGACEKVASDLGLGGGFGRLLHQLQLASQDLISRNMAEKVTKNKLPNSKV